MNERELNPSVSHCTEQAAESFAMIVGQQRSRKRTRPEKCFTGDLVSKEYRLGVREIERRTCSDNIDWSRKIFGPTRIDRCKFCDEFSSQRMEVIAMGPDAKVAAFPVYEKVLVPTHCFLTSFSHITSSVNSDREILDEMSVLMSAYTKFFRNDHDCLFTEIVGKHMRIDCYAVPKSRESAMASAYFKKALNDSEGWWNAQNKKLIKVKSFKETRKMIPRELPYFAVWFNNGEGYVHLIESRREYPRDFAQSIMATILCLENHEWKSKNVKCDVELLRKGLKLLRYPIAVDD
ncbi:hypothetical protein ACOME3_006440 [Neoechinorhynchus agilis]